MALVEGIYVAPLAGGPVSPLEEAEARGVGLTGDRYAGGGGYWQDARVSRDLTLVEGEVVDELAGRGLALSPGELRRNVVTRGIRLDGLLGSVFWVGDVLCRGTERCELCRHLDEVTGKPLLRPLVHRGGLRARLLTSGTIRVGDTLERAEELDGVGVLVVRGGRVLMSRRLAPHGRGTWSVPGGKPRARESAVACALRELREETGLEGRRGRVVAEHVDGFPESRLVFRTRFVEVEDVSGRPSRREPDKAAGWRWCAWSKLPAPLFAPVASLVRSGYVPGFSDPSGGYG
jgi:ADP-ribose pyrophosphatase YjhB (NUDIX family)